MDVLSISVSTIALFESCIKVISFLKGPDQEKLASQILDLSKLLDLLQQHTGHAATQDSVKTSWQDYADSMNDKLSELQGLLAKLDTRMQKPTKFLQRLERELKLRIGESSIERELVLIEEIKTDVSILLQLIADKASGTTHKAIAEVGQGVEQIKKFCDAATSERISQWLQLPDPSINFEQSIRLRLHGTGAWLLNDPAFAAWRDQPGSFLWLRGIPGCGKTILSSTVVESILKSRVADQPDIALVYYYFDFNDFTKRKTQLLIHYILYGLCRRCQSSFDELRKLYEASKNTAMPLHCEALMDLLHRAIDRLPETYIIIDALDECLDRESLLGFLRDLSTRHPSRLHLLITSRECDITKRLSRHVTDEVDIARAVVDQDIKLYIEHLLVTDEQLQKWKGVTIDDQLAFTYIEESLMKKAHGMFRWVYCQLEGIRKSKTRASLREMLHSLPKSLDETYKRLMDAIMEEDEHTNAVRVLQWLCYSQRPLTLAEVVEALAITPGACGGYEAADRLVDPNDLTSICTSLITVTEDKPGLHAPQVRLAHYSVKEYLVSTRCALDGFQPQECNFEIAGACLHYLVHACRRSQSVAEPAAVVEELPLYSYVSTSWFRHARLSGPQFSASIAKMAMKDLFSKADIFETWAILIRRGPRTTDPDPNLFSPLYLASWTGMSSIVQELTDKGADPNTLQSITGELVPYHDPTRKPLDLAVAEGYLDVVRILLGAGADANTPGDSWGAPLQVAARKGFTAVATLLLDHGADPNAHTGSAGNGFALHAAAENGHVAVLQDLLERGADPNQTGCDSGNALNAACLRGDVASVQLLLTHGADPHAQLPEGNALSYAAEGGHVDVVRLLVEHADVDVNAVTASPVEHATALQAAAAEGHEAAVRLLLACGADVNAGPPGCEGSALRAAINATRRRAGGGVGDAGAVVELLRERGARDESQPEEPEVVRLRRGRVNGGWDVGEQAPAMI